jgi:hypothetical protein
VKLEARAKIRVGKKTERGYPTSTDYFLSPDDPELEQLFGSQPKAIRIRFPHADPAHVWSDGLEWWVKKRDANAKPILACYTKGEGDPPIALRVASFHTEGQHVTAGSPRSSGRQPIICTFRECPQFKLGLKGCRPVGRLQFFLHGGRTDQPLSFETKSWETIENVNRAFYNAGDVSAHVFELTVAFEQRRDKRFPVVNLTRVGADARPPADPRSRLIAALQDSGRDPRDPDVAAWVNSVGIDQALSTLEAISGS